MPVGKAIGVAFDRRGDGEPLLLIHGTGGSRSHWAPVVDLLATERDMVLVDLPGHGESDPPRQGIPHTPIGYARVLAELLDELALDSAHIAGNSVGGWTALELAKLGRARSVVAIAPAGLWEKRDPWRCSFRRRSSRSRRSNHCRLARAAGDSLSGRLVDAIGHRSVAEKRAGSSVEGVASAADRPIELVGETAGGLRKTSLDPNCRCRLVHVPDRLGDRGGRRQHGRRHGSGGRVGRKGHRVAGGGGGASARGGRRGDFALGLLVGDGVFRVATAGTAFSGGGAGGRP